MVKTKVPGYLNLATISDIHLNHPRTKTNEIIAKLTKEFRYDDKTAELDVLVIAGDLFDSVMMHSEETAFAAQTFITYLLKLCRDLNIKLRVLEGTPSHDRNQSKHFVTINEAMDQKCDLKYVDILDIEYIEQYDINVLYIPDEWHHDHEVIWNQVCAAMQTKGLSHVDFIVMHGMFDYQVPRGLKLPHHNSDDYQAICKHLITIGHYHTQSRLGKILAQGSFDRLCHGQEEDKGYYRCKVCLENPELTEVTFVVNQAAKVYKTLAVQHMTLDEVMQRYPDRYLETFRDDSYVRFTHSGDPSVLAYLQSLRLSNRKVNMEFKKIDLEGKKKEDSTVVQWGVISVDPINRRTIQSMVLERLNAKSSEHTVKVQMLLEELINNEARTGTG